MAKTLCVKGTDFSTNKVTAVSFGGTVPCTAVTFSQNSYTLTDYTPVSISYSLTPSNTTDTLTWATSDSSVVTVSSGEITAVGLGTATITATCGSQSATATVTVSLAYTLDCYKVYAKHNSGAVYTINSDNETRISCFGTGAQAGTYKCVKTSSGVDGPVIKLPANTASVTVSFSSVSNLYNSDDERLIWLKDETCGDQTYTIAAKWILDEDWYVARTYPEKTFTVPEGADSFIYTFRVISAGTSTANELAEGVGLSITFNAGS